MAAVDVAEPSTPAAADGRPSAAAEDASAGDLLFEHDFGLIRPHQRVRHAFTVTNGGARAWTLRHIERTCGCTVAKCPRRILPGAAAEIEVEYRAGGAMGDDHRAVELYFHEADAPVVRFEVQVAIRPAAAPSRKELLFRGMGKKFRARETFELENFSGVDWASVMAAADAPWAAASAELSRVEQSKNGPRQIWEIKVDVDARGMKPGRHGAALEIDCGDGDGAKLPMWLDLRFP